MDILELLEYVNNGLCNGKSLVGIAKEIGVNESTIRKKLNRSGYARVGNSFILKGEVQDVVQGVVQSKNTVNNSIVVQKKDSVVQTIPNELNDLIDNHKILMDIIEQYKNNNVVQEGDIVVQLPYEEDKGYKISMRVNKPVMDRFKEFCSNNKNFTQKELLSMALIEYMENHK